MFPMISIKKPISRLSLWVLVPLVCLLAGGCASRRHIGLSAPPRDPLAMQARSLDVARQLQQQQQQKAPVNPREYEIGPLDVIQITVFNVPKYETTARVDGDGAIRFPELGVLQVGGMSERRLEDTIHTQLRQRGLVNEPQVMVFVKELHAREVTVAGEVKNPGVYPLRGGESLIDLISKAGGLMPTAGNRAFILRHKQGEGQPGLIAPVQPESGKSDGSFIHVSSTDPMAATEAIEEASTAPAAMRTADADSPSIEVDLVGLLMRGDKLWDIPLQSGDRVTVPALGWVHVTGPGVTKPGTYQLRMTSNMMRQAIDDAGGLKYTANPHLLIVRKTPDGKQQSYTVNYKDIKDDENSDVGIQGGDTIIANTTPVKIVAQAVTTALGKIMQVSITGYVPILGGP